MKTWFNYTFNKRNPNGLIFHYLRVGKTDKILEDLKSETTDLEIKWKLNEVESFLDQYFGSIYQDIDGAIVNLGIDEDNLLEFRKDFWENFVWKTSHSPVVTAFIIPNSNEPGSLTKPQIFEALSLNRLDDRAFEIFEFGKQNPSEILKWLVDMTAIVHKKARIEEEEAE